MESVLDCVDHTDAQCTHTHANTYMHTCIRAHTHATHTHTITHAHAQIAMKTADLGHLTHTREVHRKWVVRLEEEMFRQVGGVWGVRRGVCHVRVAGVCALLKCAGGVLGCAGVGAAGH